MLVTVKEMLEDAKKNHYAIPAFDVSNYEMMKAVLETCEEEKSPALLMGLGVDLEGRNLNLLTSMVKGASDTLMFLYVSISTMQRILNLSNVQSMQVLVL